MSSQQSKFSDGLTTKGDSIGEDVELKHSLNVFGSLDFQTCRLANSPKSAGREAALEVSLETCAVAVRPRDVTHN